GAARGHRTWPRREDRPTGHRQHRQAGTATTIALPPLPAQRRAPRPAPRLTPVVLQLEEALPRGLTRQHFLERGRVLHLGDQPLRRQKPGLTGRSLAVLLVGDEAGRHRARARPAALQAEDHGLNELLEAGTPPQLDAA